MNYCRRFLNQELIPYRYSCFVVVVVVVVLLLLLLGACSSRKLGTSSFQVGSGFGMKFGRIILKVNTRHLMESECSYDVILSIWLP